MAATHLYVRLDAIEQAIAAGADAEKIAEAIEAQAQSDELWAAEQYTEAVDKEKDVLVIVERAL